MILFKKLAPWVAGSALTFLSLVGGERPVQQPEALGFTVYVYRQPNYYDGHRNRDTYYSYYPYYRYPNYYYPGYYGYRNPYWGWGWRGGWHRRW